MNLPKLCRINKKNLLSTILFIPYLAVAGLLDVQ